MSIQQAVEKSFPHWLRSRGGSGLLICFRSFTEESRSERGKTLLLSNPHLKQAIHHADGKAGERREKKLWHGW